MKLADDLRRSVLQAAIEGNLTGGSREGWRFVRLGEIITKDIGGGTPDKSNSEYWNGNIPWMSVKDFAGAKDGFIEDTIDHISEQGLKHSATNLIMPGAIIICMRMGLGKYARLKKPTAINQDLRAIWLSDDVLADYFLYVYSTLKIEGTGTTVKGIKRNELLSYPFPLPPIDEQRRIVSRLDEILPLIAELESAENELEALERRFPGDMRDSLLQAAIEGRLTGSNTDNWRWVRLKEVGITSTGTTPSTEHREYYNGDIPFIGPADLNLFGTMNYDTDKKLTHEGMQKSRCVNAGSVLQVCIGTIGKVNVTEKLVCFNQQINAITPTLIDSYFLCYVLRSPYWQKQIHDNASQTTLPILNRRKWENFIIPLPPIDEQHKIVKRLNELLPLCEALEKLS